MIINVPHVKKIMVRMQVKHLLNIISEDIIWSSFLFQLWTSFIGNLF